MNIEKDIIISTLKSVFCWCLSTVCVALGVLGFVRQETQENNTEDKHQQSGNPYEPKSKQVKRQGFAHAARRRSSWGTG